MKNKYKNRTHILGEPFKMTNRLWMSNPNPLYRQLWFWNIVAYSPDKLHRKIGVITWDDHGTLVGITVARGQRRKGIATALWHAAKKADPRLHHSTEMSSEGKAWARSLDQEGSDAASRAKLVPMMDRVQYWTGAA